MVAYLADLLLGGGDVLGVLKQCGEARIPVEHHDRCGFGKSQFFGSEPVRLHQVAEHTDIPISLSIRIVQEYVGLFFFPVCQIHHGYAELIIPGLRILLVVVECLEPLVP